jgi:hypothetical protein
MEAKDTIRKLSQMTDEADFERLATAILREAKPEYASLLHPGVNPAGKTIRAPVDGISFVTGAQPPHMIAAHHTTCARGDLQKNGCMIRLRSCPAKAINRLCLPAMSSRRQKLLIVKRLVSRRSASP